jgi:hypothetical protein
MSDPLFNDVLSLNHYDANIVTDVVSAPWTITEVGGDISYSTVGPRYGTGCSLSDGVPYSSLTQPLGVDYQLPFTFEASIYLDTIIAPQGILLLGDATSGNRLQLGISLTGSGLLQLYCASGGLIRINQLGTNSLSAGQWYDIAVNSDGTNVWVYVDGVVELTDTGAVNGGIASFTTNSNIYRWNVALSAALNSLDGRLDETRITQANRYNGAPYTPAGPFPDYGPPAIISQPVSQTVSEGQSATFGVTAYSGGPPTYQWKVNGGNVGTDDNIYITGPVVAGDDGDQITVDVTYDSETVTSNAATLTVDSAPNYPATYPCPTWQYSQSTTKYQRRTPMDCGWTRQRLQFDERGQSVSLTYVMDTADFFMWADWAQDFGYSWFIASLDNYTGAPVQATIRFTSDINYNYDNFDKVTASVQGEFKDA